MEHLAWILLVALASTFGGYLGAYLKKKGENLATHEDLEKLVHQMAATTEATKAIEARISDEMWNRQRQWEMRKEIFVEATRTIAKADAVLARTVTGYLRANPYATGWSSAKSYGLHLQVMEVW